MSRAAIAGIAFLVVLFVLVQATLFTVDQTEQVLVTQFGQPVRVISQAGLHTKSPFIQTVINFDKRLLSLELPGEQVILGDQRRLVVDSFTLFRITDPLLYYQSVGPVGGWHPCRLNSIVSASLRRVLASNKLLDVLSAKRDQIMTTIRDRVNTEMKGFSISIDDVRIRRADLPDETPRRCSRACSRNASGWPSQARAEERRRRRGSVPTPRGSDRAACRWARHLGPAARRGEAEARALRQGVSSRTPASTGYGVRCGLRRRRSRPATSPGSDPGQRIHAIFGHCRCRKGNSPVASRRARAMPSESSEKVRAMRLISRPSARAAALAFAVRSPYRPLPRAPIGNGRLPGGADSFADLAASCCRRWSISPAGGTGACRWSRRRSGNSMFPPGSPFEQFFKDFLNRNRPGARRARWTWRRSRRPTGGCRALGRASSSDASGLVVTNNHVIDRARRDHRDSRTIPR